MAMLNSTEFDVKRINEKSYTVWAHDSGNSTYRLFPDEIRVTR